MIEESYFKISVNSLLAGQAITFNLYVYINGKYVLYLRSGDQISQNKLDLLTKKDTGVFYILESERKAYKAFIHTEMNSDSLSSTEKAKILRESSLTLVEELFESHDVGQSLEDGKQTIEYFVELMKNDPESIADLIGLSSHDFYTYNHSVDVSVYALGLGMVLGLGQSELQQLGQGGIFHDIGKRNVSVDIICKNGPLNEKEWVEMQQHPVFGLKILSEYQIGYEAKACCFEHHEHFCGTGYPRGLKGHDIHPMARIIALVDCYDALTTRRSYSPPMKPTEALTKMKDQLGQKYDPDMLKALYDVLDRMKKI